MQSVSKKMYQIAFSTLIKVEDSISKGRQPKGIREFGRAAYLMKI
jgi:hypothetical protein